MQSRLILLFFIIFVSGCVVEQPETYEAYNYSSYSTSDKDAPLASISNCNQIEGREALKIINAEIKPSRTYPEDEINFIFELENKGNKPAENIRLSLNLDKEAQNFGAYTSGVGSGTNYIYDEPLSPKEKRYYSIPITAPACYGKSFKALLGVNYYYESASINNLEIIESNYYKELLKQDKVKLKKGESLCSSGPFNINIKTSLDQPIPSDKKFAIYLEVENNDRGTGYLKKLVFYIPKELEKVEDSFACDLPTPAYTTDFYNVYIIDYAPQPYEKTMLQPNGAKQFSCRFSYASLEQFKEKTLILQAKVVYDYYYQYEKSFSVAEAPKYERCTDSYKSRLNLYNKYYGTKNEIMQKIAQEVCSCQKSYYSFEDASTNPTCSSFDIYFIGCDGEALDLSQADTYKLGQSGWFSGGCNVDISNLEWFFNNEKISPLKISTNKNYHIRLKQASSKSADPYYSNEASVEGYVSEAGSNNCNLAEGNRCNEDNQCTKGYICTGAQFLGYNKCMQSFCTWSKAAGESCMNVDGSLQSCMCSSNYCDPATKACKDALNFKITITPAIVTEDFFKSGQKVLIKVEATSTVDTAKQYYMKVTQMNSPSQLFDLKTGTLIYYKINPSYQGHAVVDVVGYDKSNIMHSSTAYFIIDTLSPEMSGLEFIDTTVGGQVELKWNLNKEGDFKYYEVWLDKDRDGTYAENEFFDKTTLNFIQINNLENNVEYKAKVAAVDNNGNKKSQEVAVKATDKKKPDFVIIIEPYVNKIGETVNIKIVPEELIQNIEVKVTPFESSTSSTVECKMEFNFEAETPVLYKCPFNIQQGTAIGVATVDVRLKDAAGLESTKTAYFRVSN